MKKNEKNLILLNGIFVMSLIIANILAAKVVQIGFITIPAGVVAYPITFLMTDVIGELWGKEQANHSVKVGFITQLMCIVLIELAILLPVASFANNQEMFKSILGSSARVTCASMIAYLCSQSWDVWFFHTIRNKYIEKHGNTNGGKWIWNNASTMTSQVIDTVIFIIIAFYGVVPNIWVMVLSQYTVRFIYALLDTPFFYLLTRNSNK